MGIARVHCKNVLSKINSRRFPSMGFIQVNKGETIFWKVKEEEHQESNMGQLKRAERQKDNARQSMEQSTAPTQLLGEEIINDIRHVIQVALLTMDWQFCILWEPASPCLSCPLTFLLGKQADSAEETLGTSHHNTKRYRQMLSARLMWEWVAQMTSKQEAITSQEACWYTFKSQGIVMESQIISHRL